MCSVLFLPVQNLLTCFRSSLALWTLSLSSLITLPRTVRLFYVTLRSQPPQQVHLAFLFFDVKAWPQSQTDFFTCTTVLHCGHTFIRCIDLLSSIACTMVLHCGHTFLNLCGHAVTITVIHILVTERFTQTLHAKKMADLVVVSL